MGGILGGLETPLNVGPRPNQPTLFDPRIPKLVKDKGITRQEARKELFEEFRKAHTERETLIRQIITGQYKPPAAEAAPKKPKVQTLAETETTSAGQSQSTGQRRRSGRRSGGSSPVTTLETVGSSILGD